MDIRIQIIIAILVICLLLVIVSMIRNKALELRYSLAWILVGCGILILDLFPGLMELHRPLICFSFWDFVFL